MTQPPGDFRPSRRDVLRPVEFVGGAAIAAVFTALIVLMTTRDWFLTLITAGGTFIVVLMGLALLANLPAGQVVITSASPLPEAAHPDRVLEIAAGTVVLR